MSLVWNGSRVGTWYGGIIGESGLFRRKTTGLISYRQSMHRANPYSEDMAARDVRRSTIFDEGPLAYGVTEEERLAAEPCM